MAKREADWGSLAGRIAVVTGGGSGMGRELCRQLSAHGCHVSFADLSPVEMAETLALCKADAPPGTRVTCHVCDVSKEEDILAFRDAVVAAHGDTEVVHYVFNNAGIGGGNSFLDESPEGRARWEQTFNVDWYGVYYSSRAFIPLLKRADEAALVNTSSVNGFWASVGPGSQHSAYAAAKFAVKGFTEALHVEFQTHAPHIHVAVVMPGHVGTSIASKAQAEVDPETGEWKLKELSPRDKAAMITRISAQNPRMAKALEGRTEAETDAIISKARQAMGEGFKNAGLSAVDAAGLIIRGTLEKRWCVSIHTVSRSTRGATLSCA